MRIALPALYSLKLMIIKLLILFDSIEEGVAFGKYCKIRKEEEGGGG